MERAARGHIPLTSSPRYIVVKYGGGYTLPPSPCRRITIWCWWGRGCKGEACDGGTRSGHPPDTLRVRKSRAHVGLPLQRDAQATAPASPGQRSAAADSLPINSQFTYDSSTGRAMFCLVLISPPQAYRGSVPVLQPPGVQYPSYHEYIQLKCGSTYLICSLLVEEI